MWLWYASFAKKWPPQFSICPSKFSHFRINDFAILLWPWESAKSLVLQSFAWVPDFKMLLWPPGGSIFRCMQHYVHHCYHQSRSTTFRISIKVGVPFFVLGAHTHFLSNTLVIVRFFGMLDFDCDWLLFEFLIFLKELLKVGSSFFCCWSSYASPFKHTYNYTFFVLSDFDGVLSKPCFCHTPLLILRVWMHATSNSCCRASRQNRHAKACHSHFEVRHFNMLLWPAPESTSEK